ncbi:MAG TPA: PKD domain-containing protein, partial [Candidatus Bathyarchaeia archaeon]|nr:PKD domain-containing protein [Candidatus Bathyarchaeia archaeon]
GSVRKPKSRTLLILAVLLVMAAVPTALLGIPAQISNHSLHPQTSRNTITPNVFTGRTQLGIDCGLGSTIAAPNSTGAPLAPSELNPAAATLQSRCTWIGDVSGAGDGSNEPLVSDQDESLSLTSAGIGGGFTAVVYVIQNSSAIVNGFDLQLTWNTQVLRAVAFDQTNEPTWTPNVLLSAVKTIDNANGVAELAQVISGTAGGNLTLFRMRFDVVGVGVTNLNLVNVSGGLTNPGPVVHDTFNGSFDSETVFDSAHTLNWVASFKNTTDINPGGSNTFSATVAGGTAPYTFSWQFNSCNQSGGVACVFAGTSTTNPVTVTLPAGAVVGYRIDLQVQDAALNTIHLVQHIPLTAFEKDNTVAVNPTTGQFVFSINAAQTFGAWWLGGLPGYTGSQRFCPGTTLNQYCTVPTATISDLTPTQTIARAVTYRSVGVYTNTLSITDTTPGFAGGPFTSSWTLIVNATGPAKDQAYQVTISANTTSITAGQGVLFTASAAYNATVPGALRASSITLLFRFGDGSTSAATIPMTHLGSNSTTVSHQYISASPAGGYSAFSIGTDNTISKVQETSNRIAITVAPPPQFAVTINCPASGTAGTAVTCTASAVAGTPPYSFSWTATNGSPASGTGTSFSTTYSTAGTFTISVTGTDSASPIAHTQTQSATITITAASLTVTISCPSTGTVGTAVSCTASSTGGTAPVTFAWTATGGSPASGTGASFSTTYSSKGSKTISVTGTDSSTPALTDTKSATVTIAALPLSASITCPGTGTTGSPVSCTVTATGGTSPYTFAWTATGGSPASGTGTSFSTTYSSAGTFTISVTATDTNSVTNTKSSSVVISAPALVVTITCPSTGTVGTAVSCTASSTGGTPPVTFAWTATGGSPASGTGASFSTTYNSKGSKTISVTGTDSASPANTNTKSATVTIAALPLAASITCPSTGTTGTPVTCTASATGGTSPYTFAWTATGGSPASGTGSSFSTTYSSGGTFTISVTATDGNSATNTKSAQVVISVPTLVVTITCPTSGTVGTAVNCTATSTGGTAPVTFSWTATGGSP